MDYERQVELCRQPGVGFGFSVIGGCDTHIPPMICALVRDSPALLSRQVFVGDVLEKVNGINLYNLQTKQVVDLIRGCEDNIVLCLREDRLAKLKARPFLADGTLIEPPQATVKQSASFSKRQPKALVHTRSSSGSGLQNGPSTTTVAHQSPIGVRVLGPTMSHGIDGFYNQRLSNKKNYVVTRDQTNYNNTGHNYSPVSTSNNFKYSDKGYEECEYETNITPNNGSFNPETLVSQNKEYATLIHQRLSDCEKLRLSDASARFSTHNTAFIADSNELHLNRPSSSSDIDRVRSNHGLYTETSVSKFQTSNSRSNYSSPNVFEDSIARISSEHKMLTLTPTTYSVQSLRDFTNENYLPKQGSNEDLYHRKFLSVERSNKGTAPLGAGESPTTTYLPRNSVENGSVKSSSQYEEATSPADIASRLFTLNGYKDTDIAPILGKNTEFSQQVCREYLRFYSFDGLTLDGALRLFLNKFPLTGETQERERVLIHFSKRYLECNPQCGVNEDSVHTLVCALMLLNTDLHGQGISNKMSLNDFINNLSGLNDAKDFPREQLKTLYNSIKSKKMVFASVSSSSTSSPKHKRKNSLPGNPFIELKIDSNDQAVCEGLVYRKSVMDPGGRKTPAIRRNWRPYFCLLKGIVLLSYKPDSSYDVQSIGIHHALAGYAKDYKKRAFVFKLITADWSVYYIQAKGQDEMKQWMDCINVAAAMLSSPPLPAPVSSSMRFQRPVMPVSRTKLSKDMQLEHHCEKVKNLEADLALHIEFTPDTYNKHYQDWENKLDYTEFEIKRFKAYSTVLTSDRLEETRKKLLSSLSPATASTLQPAPQILRLRSSSMHSLSRTGHSPAAQRRLLQHQRDSYAVEPISP